jgi:hypothetical protein
MRKDLANTSSSRQCIFDEGLERAARGFRFRRGLTITEVLVFLALAGILLTALWNLFRFTSISLLHGKSETNVLRCFRLATAYMRNDLENATVVDIQGPNEFRLTKILDFSKEGKYWYRYVQYSCEQDTIVRRENGVSDVRIGESGKTRLSFNVAKKFSRDDAFDRYEVRIELKGVSGVKNEADEMKFVVCPPMMTTNKYRNWNPNPGE